MKKYNYGKVIMKIYRADKNFNENVKCIKKNGTYKEYINCISIMCSAKLFGNTLRKWIEISDVNELISESSFPILSFENERFSEEDFYKDLHFIVAYFEVNKKYVLQFLKLKSKFENEFLNGRREEADSILSMIQKKFGISFWLIESKLLLYNNWDYKKYVDYYLRIRDSCKNDLLKNHIRMIKRKINLRTRTKDYENFFLENIERYNYSNELEYKLYGCYSRFMLFETSQKLSEDMKRSLGTMMYHLSFVDAWILLKKLILNLCVSADNIHINQMFGQFRELFFDEEKERGEVYHTIKRLFCESDYETCIKKCEAVLMRNGNYFEILDIYIKCLVLTEKSINLQSETSPLLKLIDVLIKCYIKEDDSDYASTYVDYCDRYSRALSDFSSYYELLGIVENTMEPWNEKSEWALYIKMFDRSFLNEESICIQKDKEQYNEKLKKNWDTLYTCEWSHEYRKKYCNKELQVDDVSKQLNVIDKKNNLNIKWNNEMTNLDRIYFEEDSVNKFQEFIEQELFIDAIHLFVDTYIKSTFLVLKMDVEKLEARLNNSARLKMLEEMDYFIFLNIGIKRREEKNVFDQAMVDSFQSILKKYQISKPSDIMCSGEQPSRKILMFWEGCCNRILNESPCDLYDDEEIDEKILLLNRIIEQTPKALYKEWLSKLELDKDYNKIINIYGKKEWITNKIIEDEILLENDENIMSSYEELCGLSIHQILENDEKVSLFKEVFARCKKEYVKQVNEQMGSRIRHSILDTEFVQLLKRFYIFFPLCNPQEKEIIFQSNPHLSKIEPIERESVYCRLQEICLKLFDEIGLAKKELIFFTHKLNYKEYTSLYVSIDELKEHIQLIEDISNETRFVSAIKGILDDILIERLSILRNKIKVRLEEIQMEYITNLDGIIKNEDLQINIQSFESEMNILVNKIVAWFNLFSNGDQDCDFALYLDEQKQIYSDFKFVYTSEKEEQINIKLKIIRDIDIVLKNLIRNIQLHAGYAANLSDAGAIFNIHIDKNRRFILKASNRVIRHKEEEYLNKKADEINSLVDSGMSLDDWGIVDGKGQGYKSIKSILLNKYGNPMVESGLENGIFWSKIEFDLERK